MSLLDEIGVRLSSQAVASSSGTVTGDETWRLALGFMPDSTLLGDTVVAVIETPGLAPDAATEIDRPGFQVLTRGESLIDTSTAYEAARAKAEEVKTALHAITPGSLGGGHHYTGIWAQQDPFFAGLDESDRPVFSQNFRAQRSRT